MFRVVRRLGVIFMIIGVLGPFSVLTSVLLAHFPYVAERFRCFLYKCICWNAGIKKITILGEPQLTGLVVFMSNHISYMDIVIFGSLFPLNFVSKDEVRQWPIIGWLAEKFGTVFISRKPSETKKGLQRIQSSFRTNQPLVLFPEGTTNDSVLPFKSSYFELPEDVIIQPVSLKYTEANGLPGTRFLRKMVSWRGNIGFLPHLKSILTIRRVGVTLIFHPCIERQGISRKTLAQACYHAVKEGYGQ